MPPPAPPIEAALRRTQAERARHQAALAKSTAKLRKLINRAFEEEYTGPELAELIGVSVPRVYQLRGRR